MNKCCHVDEDNKSTVIFETKKWTGVYPKKIKGFCTVCKKTIEFSETEYKNLMKEGELY